jgi:hypothetical protein
MPNLVKNYGFTYSLTGLAVAASSFSSWTVSKQLGNQIAIRSLFIGIYITDDVTNKAILNNSADIQDYDAALPNVPVQVSLQNQASDSNAYLRPQIVSLGGVSAEIPNLMFVRIGEKNTWENLLSSAAWTLNITVKNRGVNAISGQVSWFMEVEEIV